MVIFGEETVNAPTYNKEDNESAPNDSLFLLCEISCEVYLSSAGSCLRKCALWEREPAEPALAGFGSDLFGAIGALLGTGIVRQMETYLSDTQLYSRASAWVREIAGKTPGLFTEPLQRDVRFR
jgi:hypothetical protein